MKKLFFPFAFAVLSMPMLAAAQSQFDGTWKVDMNTAGFPKKPTVLLLHYRGEIPQGLKPLVFSALFGTTEVVP